MAQRLSPSPLVKKTKRAALCFLTLFAFSACEIVDDQRIANIQDSAAVNPIPAKREFERNNMRHKVLLGVIDSGVDYDHPAIANNIHFELDAATGTPRRLGYDYTGEDQWPSPYVARTALYDPNVSGNDLSSAAEDFGFIKSILAKGPELADYLNLSRQVNQEMASGAYHGTHVAGLMVYDRPDFGLLAYRVLPHNKDADPKHDYTSEVIQKMVDAIEKAAEDGVRVVNMSLGITIQKAILEDDGAASVLKYANLILLKAALTKAVASHPEIVFVVAAGNDSSWNDGDNLTGMPCGIKADNVICVGALRDNGQPTTFTNLIISGVDVVFALGHNVISTVPTKMCVKTAMQNLGQVGMFGVDPMTDYQALADGQFPPRFAGSFYNGIGSPIFVYIYPLPYLFGSAIHVLGFSFANSFVSSIGKP